MVGTGEGAQVMLKEEVGGQVMLKEEVGGQVMLKEEEMTQIVLKEEVKRLRYDAELRLALFAFFPLPFLVDLKQLYHHFLLLLLFLGRLLQLLLFLWEAKEQAQV